VTTSLQKSLFSWKQVDLSPELLRLKRVLDVIPDGHIIAALESLRGLRGRNAYPVRPVWNALLAGIVFQHPTVESLLRELARNAELRQVCGFNPALCSGAVPSTSAMSRFVKNVLRLQPLIEEMFGSLVASLAEALPDLGTHLAFDGKALPSHSTGRENAISGQTSDPDADWGSKGDGSASSTRRGWQRLSSWFGYQLHLIVDASYELPVAFEVKRASTAEVDRILPLVEDLKASNPTIVERCKDLAADRGLDSGTVNLTLWRQHRIRPIIDTRELWKTEKQEQGYDPNRPVTRQLHPGSTDNIVYTERGRLLCVCPVTGQQTAMRAWGLDGQALKYRCPAAACGAHCKGRTECELAALGRTTSHGRVVRVPLTTDPRIFTPTPRDTPSWKRTYARRSSVERVNARLDQNLGFENHTIRGLAKMRARVGLALVVMLATALAFAENGQLDMVRSLVGSPRRKRPAA